MVSSSNAESFGVAHIRDGLVLFKHDSTVGTIIRLNAAFMAAIAILISIRLYVRLKIVRRLGSDDVLMVFAALFTVALSALCIVGTKFGLGRHEWDLNPATVIDSSMKIVKTLFVCQVLYATAVTTTKASIIASYLRVLPTPVFRRLMYITTFLIVAMWICSVFVTIFQCDPVEGAWDFTMQNKRCLSILKFFYFASSVNILTDLVLCTSPLPLFWKLDISLKDRVILCMLFGTGVFATAASAVRLSQLHNLGSLDVSYTCVSSLNWSVVEVGTGIICASIPSLKPLLSRVFPGKFFTIPRETSRWTPRDDPTITQATERYPYQVEMGSYPKGNTALQKATFGSRTQILRSISTKSINRQGS